MNNKIQVSIIVPVYNSETYLNKCIDSILRQTFPNFELILINDGSSDNSGKICDDYAVRDNRVAVIHKENAGVSAARNDGLDIAVGEYVAFVDSDDYVDCDFLNACIHGIKNTNAELAICGHTVECLYRGKILHSKNISLQNKACIPRDILEDFAQDESLPLRAVWGKLFCRQHIEAYNLRFRLNIDYGEDALFTWQYLELLSIHSQIVLIDKVYYHYRLQKGNINSLSQKYDSERINHHKILYDQRMNLYKQHRCSERSFSLIEGNYASNCLCCIYSEFDNHSSKGKIYALMGKISSCETIHKVAHSPYIKGFNKIILSLLAKKRFSQLYPLLWCRQRLKANPLIYKAWLYLRK